MPKHGRSGSGVSMGLSTGIDFVDRTRIMDSAAGVDAFVPPGGALVVENLSDRTFRFSGDVALAQGGRGASQGPGKRPHVRLRIDGDPPQIVSVEEGATLTVMIPVDLSGPGVDKDVAFTVTAEVTVLGVE